MSGIGPLYGAGKSSGAASMAESVFQDDQRLLGHAPAVPQSGLLQSGGEGRGDVLNE